MVTVHASAALITRFDDQATRAHCPPRCNVAVVKTPAS